MVSSRCQCWNIVTETDRLRAVQTIGSKYGWIISSSDDFCWSLSGIITEWPQLVFSNAIKLKCEGSLGTFFKWNQNVCFNSVIMVKVFRQKHWQNISMTLLLWVEEGRVNTMLKSQKGYTNCVGQIWQRRRHIWNEISACNEYLVKNYIFKGWIGL